MKAALLTAQLTPPTPPKWSQHAALDLRHLQSTNFPLLLYKCTPLQSQAAGFPKPPAAPAEDGSKDWCSPRWDPTFEQLRGLEKVLRRQSRLERVDQDAVYRLIEAKSGGQPSGTPLTADIVND